MRQPQLLLPCRGGLGGEVSRGGSDRGADMDVTATGLGEVGYEVRVDSLHRSGWNGLMEDWWG